MGAFRGQTFIPGSTSALRIQRIDIETEFPLNHQEFQVRKMEVLNLIRLFWGWGYPYISLTYSLYRRVPPF